MKTLVLLSALASVAFAAPSFTGQETIRREKKSPQGYFFAESVPVHVDGSQIHVNSEFDSSLSSPTTRSFGSKKPVFTPTIIKNHHGYQLYRDSEEERAQADPLEDCSKQVKVKLCDKHKMDSKSLTRSIKENSNVEEDNMENRIKMAKEAIEDIQRGLKNKEQSSKSAGWKQREVESDAEFQQDIEVARKALDHIHRNFGNLESMSLHKEPSHQAHDENDKQNDAQRLAKWNEHIESINRNVEVGRNIEDSLQSANQQPDMNSEPFDTTGLMKNSEQFEAKMNEMPTKEDTVTSKERIASTEINKNHHIKEDMSVAASSLDSNIQKSEQKHIESQNLKARNNELTSMKTAEHPNDSDKKSFNPGEHINEGDLNNVDGTKLKAADNFEKINPDEHFQKNTDTELNHNSNMNLNLHKKSWHEAKSSEHPDSTLEKKADHVDGNLSTNFKTLQTVKSAGPEIELNNANEEQVFSSEIQHNHRLKSANNIDVPHMRWTALNPDNMENKPQLKAATEFNKEHLKGMHMHTMHHLDAAAAPSNRRDSTHGHTHSHPHAHSIKIHEHSHHAKSSDKDGFFQPNLQMNLGDFSGKSAMENALQWTHKQDVGRSAYGPYGGGYGTGSYGGGAGAVGVFPNAHVGGCAVPLLLSCSPSVVSGSLAKSSYGHAPSYGPAPAYKAAEENNHTKRDIKKTNEISKEKLTHKNIKSKATITEKKI